MIERNTPVVMDEAPDMFASALTTAVATYIAFPLPEKRALIEKLMTEYQTAWIAKRAIAERTGK